MIPDEAVEAAAKEIDAPSEPAAQEIARRALEAAAPHIAAQALEEAADAFEDLPVNKGAEISSGTWEWFELFPVQHLRDRAAELKAAKLSPAEIDEWRRTCPYPNALGQGSGIADKEVEAAARALWGVSRGSSGGAYEDASRAVKQRLRIEALAILEAEARL